MSKKITSPNYYMVDIIHSSTTYKYGERGGRGHSDKFIDFFHSSHTRLQWSKVGSRLCG